MNALHAYARNGVLRLALCTALGLAAPLACAQAGQPHEAAGVGAAASASGGDPQARFQEAMLAYERNHWSLAFVLLSALADAGHPESARIALQMWQHGPALYRNEFIANAAQIERWTRLWGCSGDATSAACQRELAAQQPR